jgi:hypothetical protein
MLQSITAMAIYTLTIDTSASGINAFRRRNLTQSAKSRHQCMTATLQAANVAIG